MKNDVLLMKDITKEKARSRVLDHFFMEILSGEIINLIGLEGSGKEEIYSVLFALSMLCIQFLYSLRRYGMVYRLYRKRKHKHILCSIFR